MILIVICYHDRQKHFSIAIRNTAGKAPGTLLEPRLFHVSDMPFLNREDTAKGLFRSIVEKGRDLDLWDATPSCAPDCISSCYTDLLFEGLWAHAWWPT